MGVFAYNYPQTVASPGHLWVLFLEQGMPDYCNVDKYLVYSPETGILFWKVDRGNRFKAGMRAGSVFTDRASGKSYIRINMIGYCYRAHILAFVLMTGVTPKHQVDHINGNGCDNRWCNLRDVTPTDNLRNKRRPRNNKSGSIGVAFSKTSKKWRAYIYINRKLVHLGYFIEREDAFSRRKSAEMEYGFHVNHGQDRPL